MSQPRTVMQLSEVEFGEDLPPIEADTSLATIGDFVRAAGWEAPRFTDHEAARSEGLPGALVPGIMSQGFLAATIHRWCPPAVIERIDTVFRAPVLADEPARVSAVVTDIDEEAGSVEIDLTITNAAGETRVFGTAKVRVAG